MPGTEKQAQCPRWNKSWVYSVTMRHGQGLAMLAKSTAFGVCPDPGRVAWHFV